MKKIFTFIAAALFAVSASATLIWSESLDKNGSYINKADFGNNWPYATQWYEKGNFVYEYDSVGSYSCSVRNKKLNSDTENSIGFFFGANKAADQCYLYLGGKEGAIVESAVGCKLMFDICSSEADGGDLSTMAVTVNGTTFPAVDLALGSKLVTSPVEFTLPDGDIEYIKITFDNVPSQKFIANLRIEGEAGTAHGQGGITPPVEELDTIGATEAKQRAEALEVGASEKVVIICYIASIKNAWNATYNNLDLWLTDDQTSTYGVISTFRTKADAAVGPTLAAGDHVQIVGNITHTTYEKDGETKHSYQVAEGAQLTLLEEEQGIENVVLTEKANKVMVDGVMYIVRDGKMFDVRGAQVR
jgi:uncharacterized protein YxeA